ncbi:MAG: glycerol-3-phosphate 1-O-acyltransferase PlsB [Nevskiales bacterium]
MRKTTLIAAQNYVLLRRVQLALRRAMNFFGLRIRWPLLGWVKPHVAPDNVAEKLALDPQRPVCYILSSSSLADFVVLDHSCRRLGLPRPHFTERRLPTKDHATCIFLPPQLEPDRSPLDYLVQRGLDKQDFDAQLVPVALYWGRDPGKETSLFRVIFSDSPLAGSLRKFFIILANSGNTLLHFGRPISVSDFLKEGEALDVARATQKLKRVLRVHFSRERVATLGPSLSRRTLVLDSLLGAPGVREALRERVEEERSTMEQARAEALRYADEIAADFSSAVIRFVELIVTWGLQRIFEGVQVYHFDRLRQYAQDHAIVYTPSHRSHFDYLFVSVQVYRLGLVPPHVAAGINMNFWPVGILLRRCGAFYLRRSFAGNKLYTAVFRAYVDVLLSRGYSMEFFPEGTRSRTGRLQNPRTGMLSMVVLSFLRDPNRAVAIFPTYVGYDKVLEVNSYFKELKGVAKKQKESTVGLLKATKLMNKSAGTAYLAFGTPIRLQEYFDKHVPDWRKRVAAEMPESRTTWVETAITALAQEVGTRINAAATLNATGLVGLVLLANPQQALAENELLEQMEHLLALLRAVPYSKDFTLLEASSAELLKTAERVARLARVPHPWGDVILAQDREAVLLTYNRNAVQHLVAVPALLARFFKNHDELDEEQLVENAKEFYPFLRAELYLRWDADEIGPIIRKYLDALVQRGLLERDSARGMLCRPELASQQFASLLGLGRILRTTLERTCMTTILLAEHHGEAPVEREQFEQQCRLMAERIGILAGLNSPEFSDPVLFRNYIETLKTLGLLQAEQREAKEVLQVMPKLREIAAQSVELVDPDTLQSILQIIGNPQARLQAAASKAA